jgi:hypothetical protein
MDWWNRSQHLKKKGIEEIYTFLEKPELPGEIELAAPEMSVIGGLSGSKRVCVLPILPFGCWQLPTK